MNTDQLVVLVIKHLKEGKKGSLNIVMEELHPYDLAELYRALPDKHHYKFLTYLTSKQIADLLMELEQEHQMEVLQKLGIEKSSKVMDVMDNDDLADMLSEISEEKLEEYLSAMHKDESKTVQQLMSYPPETAGGIMTNEFVWIRDYYTVREAVDKFKTFAELTRNIYYLYVIDENKKLVGVVSYRDMLLADDTEKIRDIMFNRVISVPIDMDQEEVAQLIQRYDFLAVPVIDENNVLKGIVTVDDVIDVFIEEANEDFEKLTATGGKSIDFNTKATVASYRRLPWLILLLFIGLITGSILDGFEATLEQVVALIFFMPMIAGMTGNTGTQSLAVVVRGLVTNQLEKRTVIKLIWREFKVGIMIGITCGILVFFVAGIWQDMMFGFVVGISLVATLIIGTMAGTIIPLILYRAGVDPAVASGPLITTLNDIFSILIYFGIATSMMHYLI